jgi:hypothetical protein
MGAHCTVISIYTLIVFLRVDFSFPLFVCKAYELKKLNSVA